MGILGSNWTLIAAVGGAIATNLVASELYGLARPIGHALIRGAARMLPPELRARYAEEWASHYDEWEANFTALWHAFSCFPAALVLRDEYERSNLSEEKSRVYRFVTASYFVLDCAVDASLFLIAWSLIIILPFLLALEIFSRGTVTFDSEYFLRKYHTRMGFVGKSSLFRQDDRSGKV